MNLLPVPANPTRVYYFKLYLYELYKSYAAGTKICFLSNTTTAGFNEAGWFPVATGMNEAVSFNKAVEPSPTYYSSIPKNFIPSEIILSRQLIGTPFDLVAVGISPSVETYPVMSGIIGSITADEMLVKLELVSENEKLRTQDILKVSQDCMNTLGIGKCTVPNVPIERGVSSLTTKNTINLFTPVPSFLSNTEYEVTIGTTSYVVDKSLSTTSILRVKGLILGLPQFIKFKKHCNQSLQQCAAYNNLFQYNGNPFLSSNVLNMVL